MPEEPKIVIRVLGEEVTLAGFGPDTMPIWSCANPKVQALVQEQAVNEDWLADYQEAGAAWPDPEYELAQRMVVAFFPNSAFVRVPPIDRSPGRVY